MTTRREFLTQIAAGAASIALAPVLELMECVDWPFVPEEFACGGITPLSGMMTLATIVHRDFEGMSWKEREGLRCLPWDNGIPYFGIGRLV